MQLRHRRDDPALVRRLTAAIQTACQGSYTFMEVCGTHTHAIGRWALRQALPAQIRLVSGPGCPVCVTPGGYIDYAARLGREKKAIIATFGDLLRVPGQSTSLEEARAAGADIRVLYSPAQALPLAAAEKSEVVFLAVGFETTIAPLAATIQQAEAKGLKNLSFLLALRLIPAALAALVSDKTCGLDGFILPGHVSAIIGAGVYRTILGAAQVPGAIAGFEPVDILQAICWLIAAVNAQRRGMPPQPALVHNLYRAVVKEDGNPDAQRLMAEVFEQEDARWRGIGIIPASGYRLQPRYQYFDAASRFGALAL
ncbi:MAG: hydrogenase formation protein HypD, partial [Planctomycetota bacterium]|nr:hydrogenase formation protein HypD [Planctomycetota bacterium]